MDKNHLKKLENEIGKKICPICNTQLMNTMYQKIYSYSDTRDYVNVEDIEIRDEYLELECPRCSYVMKFHIKSLLK